MEKKTMGSFMAALRKANGLTQQQVADQLNVSNKTISKWECNEGYPEISMLPMIAELYSVSVDELLRGERIIKNGSEESVDNKSEERIKYLIEKTMIKFTNSYIISIVLGVVALVLAYTICDIVYDYNFLWVGYVIILILCGVSIAITLVSFNNLISGLHNEDVVEKETVKCNIKKSVKYFTVVIFLATVTLLGLILDILFVAPSFLFVALPATGLVGGVIAYFVRSFLYKKFGISDSGLSPEQKRYRKKHIKITAIILSVIVFVSVASPFIVAFVNTLNTVSYCFADGVGYQYSTQEEANSEYLKLKEYVKGDRNLYNLIDEEYIEASGNYILYLEPIIYSFEENKGVYEQTEADLTFYEDFEFSSYEEAEKFKTENVYNSEFLELGSLQKDISFDDETLTVNYRWNTDYFSGALDIFPVFLIIGSCVFIVVFIVSVAIYFKKKKSLN